MVILPSGNRTWLKHGSFRSSKCPFSLGISQPHWITRGYQSLEIHLKCPTSDINTGLRVTALFWEGKVQTAKFKVSVTMAAASTSSECQWNAFFVGDSSICFYLHVYIIYIYTSIYVCTVYTVWFCFRLSSRHCPTKTKRSNINKINLIYPVQYTNLLSHFINNMKPQLPIYQPTAARLPCSRTTGWCWAQRSEKRSSVPTAVMEDSPCYGHGYQL